MLALEVLVSVAQSLTLATLGSYQVQSVEPLPAADAQPATVPSLTWVDYDGDGHTDLFVADAAGGDRLLRNLGQGVFEEHLSRSGLDVVAGSRLASWADFDADGLPDVYLVGQDRQGDLWRNMGDETFTRVGEFVGLPLASEVLGARWIDLDEDPLPDLELLTRRGATLFHNLGGAFEVALVLPAGTLPAATVAGLAPEAEAPSPDVEVPPGGGRILAVTPPSITSTGTGGRTPLGAKPFCAPGVQNTAGPGCLYASSTPVLGELYPLSSELFVSLAGSVGIGTLNPLDRLDVAGTVRSTGLRMTTGAQVGRVLMSDAGGAGSWQPLPGPFVNGSGTSGYLPRFSASMSLADSVVYQGSSGLLGVGTNLPQGAALHLKSWASHAALRLEGIGANGSAGRVTFGTSDNSTYISELEDDGLYLVAPTGVGIGPGNVGIHVATLAEATHALTVKNGVPTQSEILRLIGPLGSFGHGAKLNFGDGSYVQLEEDVDDHLRIRTRGGTLVDSDGVAAVPALKVEQSVGSGLASPALHVKNSSTFQGVGVFSETFGTDANAVFTQNGSGSIIRGFSSGLTFEVRNDGRVVCKAVEITGGSDLVESFDTSEAVEPGTVLCIDPDRPGGLMPSEGVYDSRVAGVVSGAGDLEPGLYLRQEGVAEGDTPVALTGRVYVRCSAENGAIRPGDLLTTAAVKGHAMRASDAGRSFGAVIGKAMTPLDEGAGLVLVLVNLQ